MEVNFPKSAPVTRSEKNEVTAKVGDATGNAVPVASGSGTTPQIEMSGDLQQIHSDIDNHPSMNRDLKTQFKMLVANACVKAGVSLKDAKGLPDVKDYLPGKGQDVLEAASRYQEALNDWAANNNTNRLFESEKQKNDFYVQAFKYPYADVINSNPSAASFVELAIANAMDDIVREDFDNDKDYLNAVKNNIELHLEFAGLIPAKNLEIKS